MWDADSHHISALALCLIEDRLKWEKVWHKCNCHFISDVDFKDGKLIVHFYGPSNCKYLLEYLLEASDGVVISYEVYSED